MKITEKQLQMLFVVLKDSLQLEDRIGQISTTQDGRIQLINEIISQQSDELIEVKG